MQTYIKALVDASSWDSWFFFNQGPKTGEMHHDQNISNRGHKQEEEEWNETMKKAVDPDRSLYRLTISSCHHTRGETAGQQAKGPTVQSSAHYTCIVTYIQWNAPKSHHQLTDGFGKQNIYDRGKKSSHAAVCRCVRIQAQCFHHLKYLSSCHKRSTVRD